MSHKCISLKKKKKEKSTVWLQSKAWMWGAEHLSFSSTSVGEGEISAGSLQAFHHLSLPPCFSHSLLWRMEHVWMQMPDSDLWRALFWPGANLAARMIPSGILSAYHLVQILTCLAPPPFTEKLNKMPQWMCVSTEIHKCSWGVFPWILNNPKLFALSNLCVWGGALPHLDT